MKRKKFLLLIPPKHKRIRYVRIRFPIIIFFIVIFVIGIFGLFIPLDTYTFDVIEINQKKHLTELNKKLLYRIRNMRKTFDHLEKKVDTLDQMKKEIASLINLDKPEVKKEDYTFFQEDPKNLNLNQILLYLDSFIHQYSIFIKKIESDHSYVNDIPLIKPIKGEYVITARFEKSRDPFTGDFKWHKGVDFSAPKETPVIATASGIVDLVENHKYWGKRIRIKHRFGFSTVYAHLGDVNVKKNQRVKKGDTIGTIGMSGLTIGPHLHYEVLRLQTSLNPEKYFINNNVILASQKQK